MSNNCPTCGVCPSCGHLPSVLSSSLPGQEYINVSVPVPKHYERPTVVMVRGEQFGCPTITIKQETWQNEAAKEVVTILKRFEYPEDIEEDMWLRMKELVESLEE